jgi:hypothetical protein
MRWAVIENGIVTNVILMDDVSQWNNPELVVPLETNEFVNIGWIYDENAEPRFAAPAVAAVQQRWTAYQFLQRFTAAERATMRSLALTDENVADFLQLLQAAQEVVSDDPMTVAGMDYAVSVGIVTAERKMEILS